MSDQLCENPTPQTFTNQIIRPIAEPYTSLKIQLPSAVSTFGSFTN